MYREHVHNMSFFDIVVFGLWPFSYSTEPFTGITTDQFRGGLKKPLHFVLAEIMSLVFGENS